MLIPRHTRTTLMSFIHLRPDCSRRYSLATIQGLEESVFAPGDVVRLREDLAGTPFWPTEPALAPMDGGLVVAGVHVGPPRPGAGYDTLSYSFDDVAGRWDAGLFEDAREHVRGYGILFGEDGGTWAALLDGPGGLSIGPALRIDPVAERRFAIESGIGVAVSQGEFFADLELQPRAGEIHLLRGDDGTWRVESMPWSVVPMGCDLVEADRARHEALGHGIAFGPVSRR